MASADIKNWLVDQYQAAGISTQAREWKRQKKHTDASGHVRREFVHPAVGVVAVVETAAGFAFDAPPAPGRAVFVRPRFSPQSMKLANELLSDYHRTAHAQFLEDSSSDPRYLEAYPALPTLFSFHFPEEAYDNEYSNKAGRGVKRSVRDLCVLLEERGGGDSYVTIALIQDRLEALGLVAEDEYHWSFQVDYDLTVLEWARRLVALGLEYCPEDCLFGPELTALGATRPVEGVAPPAPTPEQQAFVAALATDDAPAVARLASAGTPAWADDGRGKTWVEAALERKAPNVLGLLLERNAPLRSPGGEGVWSSRHLWEDVGNTSPEAVRAWFRSLTSNPNWDPESPVPSAPIGFYVFNDHEVLERDVWAQMALSSSSNRLSGAWLLEAWEALAGRVGPQRAGESMVRAWLFWCGDGVATELEVRCLETVKASPVLLDQWPSRSAPFHGQALIALAKSETSGRLRHALRLAGQFGWSLPSLIDREGVTLLTHLKKHERQAHAFYQNSVESQRTGIFLVAQYADGRTVTEAQERFAAWQKKKDLLGLLTTPAGALQPRRRPFA